MAFAMPPQTVCQSKSTVHFHKKKTDKHAEYINKGRKQQ